MKRASYRHGVRWIAANDAPADGDGLDQIEGYMTTLLLADIFDVEPEKVARDVQRVRDR